MYEQVPTSNFTPGRTSKIQYIVIHHWDDPAEKPSIQGVINHFKDPAKEVSAHYVVSDKRVVQMVQEKDTAWHAIQANPYTIGIEVDPNVPGDTYATVGALIRDVRSRRGDLPLRKHSDFNETSCPGDLDLGKMDWAAGKGEDMIETDDQARDVFLAVFHEPGNTVSQQAINSIKGQSYATVIPALTKYAKWRDQNDKLVAYDSLAKSKAAGTLTDGQKQGLAALEALKEALK